MSETRISRRRVLQRAGIAGVAGLAALAPTGALASSTQRGADPLAGAWQGTLSSPILPTFGLLTSFAVAGTLVASASIDLNPNFLSTPGYGAWRRTDPGTYTIKFRFFTFDARGNPSGSGEQDATVTVEGNHLEGPFTVKLLTPAGNVVFTAAGTWHATRIEAG